MARAVTYLENVVLHNAGNGRDVSVTGTLETALSGPNDDDSSYVDVYPTTTVGGSLLRHASSWVEGNWQALDIDPASKIQWFDFETRYRLRTTNVGWNSTPTYFFAYDAYGDGAPPAQNTVSSDSWQSSSVPPNRFNQYLITKAGASVGAVTGSWSNTSNAVDTGTGTEATVTSTVANAVNSIEITGFDFSFVPLTATIVNVLVWVGQYQNSTSAMIAPTLQQISASGTTFGGVYTLANTTTTSNLDVFSVLGDVTIAQLQGSGYGIKFNANKANNTTSGAQNLDFVEIEVIYTVPGMDVTGTLPATSGFVDGTYRGGVADWQSGDTNVPPNSALISTLGLDVVYFEPYTTGDFVDNFNRSFSTDPGGLDSLNAAWTETLGDWFIQDGYVGVITEGTGGRSLLTVDVGVSDGTMRFQNRYGDCFAFRIVDENDYLFFRYRFADMYHYQGGTYHYLGSGIEPEGVNGTDYTEFQASFDGPRVEISCDGAVLWANDININTTSTLFGFYTEFNEGSGVPAEHYAGFQFTTGTPVFVAGNDDIANRKVLTGDSGSDETPAYSLATTETDEPDLYNCLEGSMYAPSWWYEWTAPSILPHEIMTFRNLWSNDDFLDADEPLITVFKSNVSDPTVTDITPVVTSNETYLVQYGTGLFDVTAEASARFVPEPSRTYYVQFKWGGGFGDPSRTRFEWFFEDTTRPANDEPTGAIAITGITGSYGPFTMEGSTYDYMLEPDPNPPSGEDPFECTFTEVALYGSVWFNWTCPLDWDVTKFVQFYLDGTTDVATWDGVAFSVFTGTDYDDLVAIGGSHYTGSWWQWSSHYDSGLPGYVSDSPGAVTQGVEVIPGENYLVYVGCYANPFTDLVLSWDDNGVPPPPLNDPYEQCVVPDPSRSYRLTYATTEAGEPLLGSQTRTVWFCWSLNAPYPDGTSVLVTLSNETNGPFIVYVYENGVDTTIGNLVAVGNGVDTMTFTANLSTTYYIQVGDQATLTTPANFNIFVRPDPSSFTPPPNDEPTGAIVLPHSPDTSETGGYGELCDQTLLGATLTPDFPNDHGMTQDVWYTIVASNVVTSITPTAGTSYYMIMEVYNDTGTTLIAYGEGFIGYNFAGTGTLTFPTSVGQPYLVRVGAKDVNGDNYPFCLRYTNPGVATNGAWKIYNYNALEWQHTACPVPGQPRLKVYDYVNAQWWASKCSEDEHGFGPWIQAPDVVMPERGIDKNGAQGHMALYQPFGGSDWSGPDASLCAFTHSLTSHDWGGFWWSHGNVLDASTAPGNGTPTCPNVDGDIPFSYGTYTTGDIAGCRYEYSGSGPFLAGNIDWFSSYASHYVNWDNSDTAAIRAVKPTSFVTPVGTTAFKEYEPNHVHSFTDTHDPMSGSVSIAEGVLTGIQIKLYPPTSIIPGEVVEYYFVPYRESASFGPFVALNPYGVGTSFKAGSPNTGGGQLMGAFSSTAADPIIFDVPQEYVYVPCERAPGSTAYERPYYTNLINAPGLPTSFSRESVEYGRACTFMIMAMTPRERSGDWPSEAVGRPGRSYEVNLTSPKVIYTVRPPRYRYAFPDRPFKGYDYVNNVWSEIACMIPAETELFPSTAIYPSTTTYPDG